MVRVIVLSAVFQSPLQALFLLHSGDSRISHSPMAALLAAGQDTPWLPHEFPTPFQICVSFMGTL